MLKNNMPGKSIYNYYTWIWVKYSFMLLCFSLCLHSLSTWKGRYFKGTFLKHSFFLLKQNMPTYFWSKSLWGRPYTFFFCFELFAAGYSFISSFFDGFSSLFYKTTSQTYCYWIFYQVKSNNFLSKIPKERFIK